MSRSSNLRGRNESFFVGGGFAVVVIVDVIVTEMAL